MKNSLGIKLKCVCMWLDLSIGVIPKDLIFVNILVVKQELIVFS